MLQPYQVLFPLGFLYAIGGALVWIFFARGNGPYPGPIHAVLMIGGFLLSFASGFLMTALPKFLGAPAASRAEMTLAVGVNLVILSTALLRAPAAVCYGGVLGVLLYLIVFAARRLRARTEEPPEELRMAGLGLLLALSGTILLLLNETRPLTPELFLAARRMLFYDFFLCLVLGIGKHLIPMLQGRGWGESPEADLRAHGPFFRVSLYFCAVLLGALGFPSLSLLLRWVVVTWIAFGFWKIHRAPPRRGNLSSAVRAAGWSIWIGIGVQIFMPAWTVHAAHLVYVSGLGLLTLMVASRVTLAHGGYDLSLEGTSRTLKWSALLVLLAAFTRVSAPWMGTGYGSHLAYAATVWIAALALWGAFFIPKMIHESGGEC